MTNAMSRKYYRSCRKFLRKVALECLKKYGVYIFIIQVAEPGVNVKTELCDILISQQNVILYLS